MVNIAFQTIAWTNQDIVLYHGTIAQHAQAILASGVDLSKCDPNTDFGRGFYTTTVERQARAWAWQLSQRRQARFPGQPGSQPAVLKYAIPRDALAELQCLVFVLGTFDADDYWSLVTHCRTTTIRAGANPDGHRPDASWYDVAAGPVSAFWVQRSIMADADQIGFHTDAAANLLNAHLPALIP